VKPRIEEDDKLKIPHYKITVSVGKPGKDTCKHISTSERENTFENKLYQSSTKAM
jgi:hypothetical protein